MIERAMRTSNPARLPNSFNSRRTRQREGGEPYHRITNFLPEQEAQYIVDRILSQQSKFCLMTGNRNFLSLPGPIETPPAFHQRLLAVLPEVQDLFGINLERPEIELYVHAYNDGTHFGRHSDAYGGGNCAGAFPVFSTPFANHADSREVIWSCMTGGDALLPLNPNTTRQCSSRVICFMKCYL
jgi:hypothetical protein